VVVVVVITAFMTAMLLACDAWFDITTASGRAGALLAIASAVFPELPLATLLFAVAHHLLHFTLRRAQAGRAWSLRHPRCSRCRCSACAGNPARQASRSGPAAGRGGALVPAGTP
jgi:hypothetical protein